MLLVEQEYVSGWEAAVRSVLNELGGCKNGDSEFCGYDSELHGYVVYERPIIGENDLFLLQTLVKSISGYSKFLQMINVTWDITAPLNWWEEFSFYAVGIVDGSHDMASQIWRKEFELSDLALSV